MSRPSQACGAFKTQEKPPTTINFDLFSKSQKRMIATLVI